MAKKKKSSNKGVKKSSSSKGRSSSSSSGKRQERRFISQGGTNVMLVRLLGALSAIALGAGVWAYVYAKSFAEDEKFRALPSYLIAGGAVLLGITIWLGTSGEAPLRVGDPGIAVEKGETRRMPWWCVQKITFESGTVALLVTGKDEAGTDWTFKVPLKSHAEAAGWIIKEALDRIPRRVDIPDETIDKLPMAGEHAGTKLLLEPLQVVGKRDAITGKTISYEPDARVCGRCERVYFKRSVPKKCKCGNSLAHMRPEGADADEESSESSEEESESRTSESSTEATSTSTSTSTSTETASSKKIEAAEAES
jgi:hypothetical protein